MTKVTIVSGGLREPSSTRLLAGRLDEALRTELEQAGATVEATILELRPLGRSVMDAMITGVVPSQLQDAFDTIADADAVVAVTPAFNVSYSGLFKSFFDVLPEQTLDGMPVLIAATGGTERHSLVLELALRPMFSYLHAIVSPTGVYAATHDFGAGDAGSRDGGNSPITERIRKATADFARLVQACGPHQRRDPFDDDIATMQQLLTGTSEDTPR